MSHACVSIPSVSPSDDVPSKNDMPTQAWDMAPEPDVAPEPDTGCCFGRALLHRPGRPILVLLIELSIRRQAGVEDDAMLPDDGLSAVDLEIAGVGGDAFVEI